MYSVVDFHFFLEFVKAGLWEKDFSLSLEDVIDYSLIMRLAEEQAVVGLVTAGLEHTKNVNVPKDVVLQLAGQCMQLEQRNNAMNNFIGVIIQKLRAVGIYTLLVKGQGIAQCYERPLWRSSGDIDFFLSDDNYLKAENYLSQIASTINEENPYNKHLALTIDPWSVELHGTLRGLLKKSIDRGIDEAQRCVFFEGNVRSWQNGNIQVFLPGIDEDVVFVFTHLLQHFFKERVLLRQICDWCRLLWSYNSTINRTLLENRIHTMGIMSEWKAFSSLAVDYLGMPDNAMPFYSPSKYWSYKARLILKDILQSSQLKEECKKTKSTTFHNKTVSFWRHTKEGVKHMFIFPVDSLFVWGNMIKYGIGVVIRHRK